MHYAIIIVFAIGDIVNQFSVRDVLYDFLRGSTSKKNFRNIRHASRPLIDKVTLSFIRAYIKSDVEKQSFNRYYIYNICSTVLIPVKFITAIVVIKMQLLCFKYLVSVYVLCILIKMFVWSHERNILTKYTPHAGRKYNRKPQKKH